VNFWSHFSQSNVLSTIFKPEKINLKYIKTFPNSIAKQYF
jgi:hypothetical protein